MKKNTYYDYLKENYSHEDFIMAFKDEHKIRELGATIKNDDKLEPVYLSDKDGMRIYHRSASFVLITAVNKVFPGVQVIVNQHMSGGYFCEFSNPEFCTPEHIAKIKEQMQLLIDQKLPIIKDTISVETAMQYFERNGMKDKSELFHYRKSSTVNTYILDGVRDYFYGYMLPNTECIHKFDLYCQDHGFVLLFPDEKEPTKLAVCELQPKLAQVYKQSKDWARILGVDVVSALNKKVIQEDIKDLITTSEALHEKKIAQIADAISNRKDTKLILIAGPSSSGKTTFSSRLCTQLRVNGLNPKILGMDDYFVTRNLTPKDEFGNYDFDSLSAMDVDLFNKHLSAVMAGECVELPTYNFKIGSREYKGNTLQLEDNDILIVEGIHALNEEMSKEIAKEYKFKIYVSCLMQLNIDNHNRIPTTDVRLIRRMVRDNMSRSLDPEYTLSTWYSVRRGEIRNIFPFQEDADMMFNSVIIYELAVLKQKAEALLFTVPRTSPYYNEAKRLMKFLDYFVGIDTGLIPQNSILREFLGE